jgi:hypothetical protein
LTLSLGVVVSCIISWIIGLAVMLGVLIFIKNKQKKAAPAEA